jgi:hypothetical protein
MLSVRYRWKNVRLRKNGRGVTVGANSRCVWVGLCSKCRVIDQILRESHRTAAVPRYCENRSETGFVIRLDTIVVDL